jgi:hypothetical protein
MFKRRFRHMSAAAAAQLPAVRPTFGPIHFLKLQMEVDMTAKITAAVAAAFLLATVGAASARPTHFANTRAASQSAYADSYFNKDYWDAISPAGRIELRDPFVGTPFENVVPY